MCDAVVIVASEQWGHGDDVLWVVVIDGSEITKLPFSCSHVGYDVRGLHIDTLSIGLAYILFPQSGGTFKAFVENVKADGTA